ncbi:MAG: hypothetical protein ACNA8P_07010, partial [Phycisphaerales bacterium]
MKISKLSAFAALAVISTATVASASTMYFTSGIREAGFAGGEFISNLSNGATYRSFCLELDEVLVLGNQGANNYLYEITTDGAVEGGISGGNPDPVSSASASIFVAWLNGSIVNNVDNAVDVQNAIWALEGEINPASLSGFALTLYDDALLAFPDLDDNAALRPDGLFGNIRVLNPYRIIDGQRVDYQSQIILIPLPTASGLALAGLALVGGI